LALQHLWCKRNDLHKVRIAKFASHWTKDTGPSWLIVDWIDDDACVFVEPERAAINSAARLLSSNNDATNDITLLYWHVRSRGLDCGYDKVANATVSGL
jgi:hypothetical protein